MRYVLQPELPAVITVDTGSYVDGAARATVYADEPGGKPASGVPVRFRVLRGTVDVGSGGEEIQVASDENGHVAVGVRMREQGQALIGAFTEGRDEPATFLVRTEGVVDRISLYAAPAYSADEGVVRARAVAVDHRGEPVEGAQFFVQLAAPADHIVRGKAADRGGGVYDITVETREARQWTLSVKDKGTHVIERRCVWVLPGKPSAIGIEGNPDPRTDAPFDRVTVRGFLRDAHGNDLDPGRLRAFVDGQDAKTTTIGGHADVSVRFVGYGERELRLTDPDSGLELVRTLLFPAVWFTGPKIVEPGSSFMTPVYAIPPPDRPARKATIEITYDPKLTAFSGLAPLAGAPPLAIEHHLRDDQLILDVTSQREIPADAYPEGIPICTVVWSCVGEGDSCFTAIAKMSPSHPGTGICVRQKHDIPNRVCVCTNVIFRSWHPQQRLLGRDMVRQAMRIITRNDWVCCPHAWSVMHECEITTQQWLRLISLWWGEALPQDDEDLDALFESGICQRPNCLNIYVIECQQVGVHGRTQNIPSNNMIIDPNSFPDRTSLAAHEFGHALGLQHRNETSNVMVRGAEVERRGQNFSSDQCETIWTSLLAYPC